MPGYLTAMGWFPAARIAAAIQINTDDMRAVRRPLAQRLAKMTAAGLEKLGD